MSLSTPNLQRQRSWSSSSDDADEEDSEDTGLEARLEAPLPPPPPPPRDTDAVMQHPSFIPTQWQPSGRSGQVRPHHGSHQPGHGHGHHPFPPSRLPALPNHGSTSARGHPSSTSFHTLDPRHLGRQNRAHSQSTGALVGGHLPGVNRSSESLGHGGEGSGYPNRSHSYGAVASHFLAQPPDAYGGQTWVDFLRESGAEDQSSRREHNINPTHRSEWPPQTATSSRFTLPARPPRTNSTTSVNSIERKRRLTAPESPGRQTSGRRTRSNLGNSGTGGSSTDPITLPDSLPPPPPPPPHPQAGPRPPFHAHPSRSSAASTGRRPSNMSDITLPTWQPDSDVHQCPVCRNQFTFFYRKHHCRKCGRVVCAACSPHRITIPRQFIVHPPSEFPTGNIIDLTGSDDENQMSAFGPFRNPALGGGEVVRVCNPCVPDPNFSPPPQPPPPQYTRRPEPGHFPGAEAAARHSFPRGHRPSHSESHSARDAFNRDGVIFQNRSRVADLWPPTQVPPGTQSRPLPNHSAISVGYFPQSEQHHTGRDMHGNPHLQAPRPPPRRQIAEEDECPVCGNELPPKGPDGDETAREEHINDCITSFAGVPSTSTPSTNTNTNPAASTSTSLPNPRARGMSDAAAAVASLGAGGGGSPIAGSSSNRMSIQARGLFPYTATEKDCVDEGGEAAECVICFEEFEAGDRMARLVCWCKFHEDCIRAWWEKKGRGACPTHQLHD